MDRTERMMLAKKYGSIRVHGKKYWRTSNIVREGDHYASTAVDRQGNKYKFVYALIDAYVASQRVKELNHIIYDKKRSLVPCQSEISEQRSLELAHGLEIWALDENSACDWLNPSEIIQL